MSRLWFEVSFSDEFHESQRAHRKRRSTQNVILTHHTNPTNNFFLLPKGNCGHDTWMTHNCFSCEINFRSTVCDAATYSLSMVQSDHNVTMNRSLSFCFVSQIFSPSHWTHTLADFPRFSPCITNDFVSHTTFIRFHQDFAASKCKRPNPHLKRQFRVVYLYNNSLHRLHR